MKDIKPSSFFCIVTANKYTLIKNTKKHTKKNHSHSLMHGYPLKVLHTKTKDHAQITTWDGYFSKEAKAKVTNPSKHKTLKAHAGSPTGTPAHYQLLGRREIR